MHTIEVRPWRLVVLFGSVLLLTAYLPHPNLGKTLPQSLGSLVKVWLAEPSES
ncbi:MAG: hypothetical protein F6J95_017970 [Leptolyngbya sp. SIO1E4]|nr:hypothetical protein [Leptolyngbya sp. SIO1E4]